MTTSDVQIRCGDILEVARSITAGSVDLVFADPPFNLGKEYSHTDDDLGRNEYIEWTRSWLRACANLLKNTGSVYVMTIQKDIWIYQQLLEEMGFLFRNIIAWKNSSMPIKNRYCINYQPIIYFTKTDEYTFNCKAESHISNAALPWGRKNKGNLMIDQWNDIPYVSGGCMAAKEAIFESGTKKKAHPCQMPVRLAERVVKFSSNPGDLVLDPFVGSGTTAEACLRLGRRFIGVDVSPEYCAIANARLERAADTLFETSKEVLTE